MTPAEAAVEMAKPKLIYGPTSFVARLNHFGHQICVAQLQDSVGVLYPALTIQIEVKAPIFVERCYYTFSLMLRRGRDRIRVYQLEVVPPSKISHRGLIDIAGPHEHFGDEEEPSKISDPVVNCENWAACVGWFSNKINLQQFQLASPC
jgi:hypothetical protein